MLKSDLIGDLNAASKKLGAGPVTDRMVRDWIDERLLAKSKAVGNRRGQPPVWTYSDETLRRAMRIVQLRAQGVHRAAALRVNLWIDGLPVPVEDMKLALKWEFGRVLAQLRRRRTWRFDARYRRRIPEAQLNKEGGGIEPVDSDLATAGFSPPWDVLLHSGEKGPVQGSIEAVFSGPLAEAMRDTGIYFAPPAGLFGNPEEIDNAGLTDLARVTEGADLSRLDFDPPKDVDALRTLEANSAAAYFRAWKATPLRWKKSARHPIPEDWRFVGSRTSRFNLAGNRNASHPLNAIMNYAYAILQSEVQIKAVTDGYDPMLGIMHYERDRSHAFVFDLMEPGRPGVDRAVLAFLKSEPLHPADFTIREDGVVRLNPDLARRVAQLEVRTHLPVSDASGSR